MVLNNQHKIGIVKLGVLLGVICFLIVAYNKFPRNSGAFVLNKEAQCFVDNKQSLLAEAKSKKAFSYYVNSISDYTGYQLGLSPDQIDRLLAYRKTGKRIYTINEFKQIAGVNLQQLDTIRGRLKFPKKKFQKFKKKKISVILKQKIEMNSVSAKELKEKLQLPEFLANRIVNFRTSLNGFSSMDQLKKVYGILPYQLKRLSINGYLKK